MWKIHRGGEKCVSAVVGKYQDKGQLGRHRLRREGNIEMEPRNIGCKGVGMGLFGLE